MSSNPNHQKWHQNLLLLFILFIGKTDAVQPAQNTAVLMETDCALDDKVNDVIGEYLIQS